MYYGPFSVSKAAEMLKQPRTFSWKLVYMALLPLFILLTVGALLFFRYQVNLIRENKYTEIRAIARLKSDEIVRWLGERYSDADYFSSSAELKSIISMAEKGTNDSILQKDFNRVFQRMKKNHHYADVIVSDLKGHILYSFDISRMSADSDLMSIVSRVQKSQKILLHDFSRSPDGKSYTSSYCSPGLSRITQTRLFLYSPLILQHFFIP